MALTISNLVNYGSVGTQYKINGQITFDSSYPTGGEVLTASQLGLTYIESFEVPVDAGGYTFGSNLTTPATSLTVKVFQGASGSTSSVSGGTPAGTVDAPTFAGDALAAHGHTILTGVDEIIAVTAGTGVSGALGYLPIAAVSSVYISAGGVTGAATIVPSGSVANSKEVSVDYSTGVLQFLVADAVTQAKVSYAKAAADDVSAGTPSGTNSAPAFTGVALTGHTHAVGAAAGGEVPNGTDLSTLTIQFEAFGK